MNKPNKPNIVAHRGASAYAYENTLTAFELAAKMGATMIELDIRRSADDKPVVFHDALIPIPSMGELRVERLDLITLINVPLPRDERIPSFESVVNLCCGLNLGMYIEFKETTESLTRWIIETLRRAHMLDRAILFSSRPDHVFFAKKVDPKNVRTAFSYRQSGIDPILMAQACHADGLNLAWEDYLHPYMHITPAWLTRVRAAGLRLMSWHEERERELRELIRLGIDDVCTNDPALAHKLIEEISGT